MAAPWLCGLLSAKVGAQYLPGPTPPPISQAVLPTGISEEDVELFGRYCYVWQEQSGTQVIQYEGEFALDMGQRRVRSQDAVVWITRSTYQGRTFAALELFLWRDAKVVEPGGTVTRGEVLFATLNTFGKVRVSCASSAPSSAENTALYRQASRVRQAFAEAAAEGAATQPSPLTVLRTREPNGIRPRAPERRVIFRAEQSDLGQVDDRPVITARGNVYVGQGQVGAGDFLELRADAAVIWLRPDQMRESLSGALGMPSVTPPAETPEEAAAPETAAAAAVPAGDGMPAAGLGAAAQAASAVYLEGDVVLNIGERTVRARRLYYDFETDQAYILDAVVSVVEPTRGVPLYIRADEVRQLARDRYVADNAKISTDEFAVPHYHIGAERVVVVDRTPRDATGQIVGVEAGSIAARDVTFNINNTPIFWWPYTRADVRRGELALRSFRMGYSDEFGVSVGTRWNLFTLLGMLPPEGFNADLRLDYYSERGPGVGIDMDYRRENAFGLLRSYFIYDQGEDDFGQLRRGLVPPTDTRGRFTWRHRQYLPQDWQVTLEFSYLSDANFLEEYFPDEFFNGKEQENLLYVKKQQDNWAFTGLAKWRLNDFLTQTESLPDFSFYLLGEPLLDNTMVLFSEARAGLVRYRPDDRRLFNSHRFIDNTGATRTTTRTDMRQEINVPIDVGPARVVPFGMVRGTYWDQSEVVAGEGALFRDFYSYGLRSSAYAWRVYDGINSRLLDVHRLRHVIKPQTTFWFSESPWASRQLTPFTESVETIDDFDGFTFDLRQIFQTQRGGPGQWRIVDWITFDLTVGLFDEEPANRALADGNVISWRPEESIARDFVEGKLSYRLSDSAMVVYNANYDLDREKVDVQNLTLSVERDPRLSYLVGWREIDPTNSNLIGFGANYKATEKHTFALRSYYDLQRSSLEELELAYIRKLPRWYVATTFKLDEIEDDFGVSISVWPEGIPEATIGGRRYTGIPEHIGITP